MSSFVVLLVGLVILPYAVPTCKNLPAIPGFNSKKFFKGVWYITHMEGDRLQRKYCTKVTSQMLGNLVRQVYTVKFPNTNTAHYSESLINLPLENVGKFINEIRVIKKDGTPIQDNFQPVQETVIDTDYTSYAILFICSKHSNEEVENYTVLSRNINPHDINPKVEYILKKLGLNLSDFYSPVHVICDFED